MTIKVAYPTSSNAYITGCYVGAGPSELFIHSAKSAIGYGAVVLPTSYNGYIPPPPAPEVVEKRCDYCNSFVTEESKKNRECRKCGAPV